MSFSGCEDGGQSGEPVAPARDSSPQLRKGEVIRSPKPMVGSRLGLREVNVICWGILVTLALIIGTLVWGHVKGGEGFDFVYFYGVGRLASEHPPARLYDYASQLQVFHDVRPAQKEHYGPSPYPPFVGLFFSNFSRLPFQAAYFLWMAISLALYVLGVRAVLQASMAGEPLKASLATCFALAFPPFLLFTLVNGQLASVAVFCVGFAIYEEERQKLFLSGLFLSILAYKPTLLLLIVPMLCLTRRFKTLMGFIAGVATLVGVSTAFAGMQVWPAYVRLIETFRKLSAGDTSSGITGGLRRWQFVDLRSLTYSIPGSQSRIGLALTAVTVSVLAVWLAVLFWRSAKGGRSVQHLVWGAALIWTLLLNIYVPIYDSVLAVIAILLTIAAVENLRWQEEVRRIVLAAIAIFVVSWFTRAFAEHYGIQLLTLLFFGFGVAQACLLQRSFQLESADTRRSISAEV